MANTISNKKTSPLHKKKSSDSKTSKLFRIFDKNYVWNDKDEVLDSVYWYRQALALIMGLVWGILGVTGSFGILSFILLNSLAAYGIANNTGYEFDPDEGFLSVKEGFMATFATFLVTWVVTYTATHFSHL